MDPKDLPKDIKGPLISSPAIRKLLQAPSNFVPSLKQSHLFIRSVWDTLKGIPRVTIHLLG